VRVAGAPTLSPNEWLELRQIAWLIIGGDKSRLEPAEPVALCALL
jgi:hypothetical protein